MKKESYSLGDLLKENSMRQELLQDSTPRVYALIQKSFEEARINQTDILLEVSEISSSYSVKIKIDEVYTRWCLGHQDVFTNGKHHKVPYTIHYSDILQSIGTSKPISKVPTIIFRGDNAFV